MTSTAALPCAWAGQLRLEIASRDARSFASRQFHEGALRVLRPHYLDSSGQVSYTVINPGGAYLGADRYLLDVDVAAGASLLLTTQSATKVYRTPQGPARQEMTLRLGAGAVLEYVPDQLIVYRGGSYLQRTLVEMDPTAALVLAEIVTPGWSPDGEQFAYDALSLRTEVRVATPHGPRRLAVDQLRITPGSGPTGLGLMEGYSHSGQLLLAGQHLDDALYERITGILDDSDAGQGTYSGISRAGEVGSLRCVCVRTLARRTQQISRLHHEIVDAVRAQSRDQPPLRLRKY